MEIFRRLESEGFFIKQFIDYSEAEQQEVFLEGTGSLILDRVNKKAYCALSPRADESLFIEFCEDFEFDPIVFTAYQTVDNKRLPIYHTNVMMCIADSFCVICLDAIDDKKERKAVVSHLKQSGKEIIKITEEQVQHFAGNMLQVQGSMSKFLVMSAAAERSLNAQQRSQIERYCLILSSEIDTIETCGGGSARCMMAEVFLPRT